MDAFLQTAYDFDPKVGSVPPSHDWISAADYSRIHEARLIAIVGSSGSGKSLLGQKLCQTHFVQLLTEQEQKSRLLDDLDENKALDLLCIGLKSLPAWTQSLESLSCGERYRALLALRLRSDQFIDEFTSHLDRLCAVACSRGLSKLVHRKKLHGVCVGTCHRDILPFLAPDIVIDCDNCTIFYDLVYPSPSIAITSMSSMSCQPPCPWGGTFDSSDPTKIKLTHVQSDFKRWPIYEKHHYLTRALNKAARCHEFFWHGIPVCFIATLNLVGRVKHSLRESRLVVLPFCQGLGIGTACSEYVGRLVRSQGLRYFAKTSHPALGLMRNGSKDWRPTAKNGKTNTGNTGNKSSLSKAERCQVCYCHEYVPSLELID